jgi:hypothetical protein
VRVVAQQGRGIRTTSPSTAYSPIPRVVRVTTDIPDPRIIQAFSLVLPPEHVFDTPETSRSDRGGLRARRHIHGLRGRIRHTAEGAEEFGQKGHGKVRRGNQNEEREELQIGGSDGERGRGLLCW